VTPDDGEMKGRWDNNGTHVPSSSKQEMAEGLRQIDTVPQGQE